jgi:hypothetical protein
MNQNTIQPGNLVRVSSIYHGKRWVIVSKVNAASILVNVSGIANVGKRVSRSSVIELDASKQHELRTWDSIFGEPYKA